MQTFQLALLAILVGVGFSIWFESERKGSPVYDLILPSLSTIVITVSIVAYIFYRLHSGKTAIPQDQHEARLVVLREMVAASPLFVCTIATIYFLTTDRLTYITPVVMPSLPLWLLLRLVLKRRVKR